MAVDPLRAACLRENGSCQVTGMSLSDIFDTVDASGVEASRTFISGGSLVVSPISGDEPNVGEIWIDTAITVVGAKTLVEILYKKDLTTYTVRNDQGTVYNRGILSLKPLEEENDE
jgi:hypothetical protein